MNIIADTHTHTISSTHAFSTVQEMVKAAADMHLYAIALTDHGYTMPGAPGRWFFESLFTIPEVLYGVRVLKGVEANVADFKGSLDMEKSVLKSLEWVVASMHGVTLKEKKPSIEKCTQAWLNIAENPDVNVIGHSGTPEYKYDYERVIPILAKNGKLIEINNGSFRFRKGSMDNCVQIARVCKKYGARIVVNTDSHFSTAVGHVEDAMAILKDIDFPQKLIVNSSLDSFKGYLKEHNINC
ncbi:MAG TPA: phosphatase [Clostridiales bacterium]|nr:phosphatase [Clostridiales bacterium]